MTAFLETRRFGALYRSRTLRRTEDSKRFGEKILDLPPVHQKDMDVAFPIQYREALKTMTHRIANKIEHGINQGSFKQKMNTFYKTITRQQLLASTSILAVSYYFTAAQDVALWKGLRLQDMPGDARNSLNSIGHILNVLSLYIFTRRPTGKKCYGVI